VATDSDLQDLNKTRRVAQALRKPLRLFNVKPQPPRGVQFNPQGYVAWAEPKELRNVTHYNVYAGSDSTLYRRYPVGTTLMNDLMPYTSLVWVSSYNQQSDLESPKVQASQVGSSTGNTGIPGAPSTAAAPAGPAPNVTGLSVANATVNASPGGSMVRVKGTFTPPADTTDYLGARVIMQAAGDTSWAIVADLGPTEAAFASVWMPSPQAATIWTVKVQSYNIDGALNPLDGNTPTATTTIAAGVAGYDLRLVLAGSYDTVGFTLDPGSGKFVINQLDLTKAFNINTAQFNTVGGFSVKALSASVINTGTLKVGGDAGGATVPGQILVVDADNATMLGWIGKTSDNAYRGGWFKNLYVGGTDPSSALFSCVGTTFLIKGAGIVVGPGTTGGNGEITVYDSAAVVGWIGSSGTYRGGWFKNLYIGGSDPGSATIYCDTSGNAYFKGAIQTGSSIASGLSISAPTIIGGSLSISTSNGTVSISAGSSGVGCSNSSYTSYYGASQLYIAAGAYVTQLTSTSLSIGSATVILLNQFVGAGGVVTTGGVSCNSLTVGGRTGVSHNYYYKDSNNNILNLFYNDGYGEVNCGQVRLAVTNGLITGTV